MVCKKFSTEISTMWKVGREMQDHLSSLRYRISEGVSISARGLYVTFWSLVGKNTVCLGENPSCGAPLWVSHQYSLEAHNGPAPSFRGVEMSKDTTFRIFIRLIKIFYKIKIYQAKSLIVVTSIINKLIKKNLIFSFNNKK